MEKRQDTVDEIIRQYQISNEERNDVIFDTGLAFAKQFKDGRKIVHEKLFWEVFRRVFLHDDEALLQTPQLSSSYTYRDIKAQTTASYCFKKNFCRKYYSLKKPAAARRQSNEIDLLRKRLIASIGGWLTLSGKEGGIDIIKGIACRAAGKEDFNMISPAQLKSLYSAFLQKQKDVKNVNTITQ